MRRSFTAFRPVFIGIAALMVIASGCTSSSSSPPASATARPSDTSNAVLGALPDICALFPATEVASIATLGGTAKTNPLKADSTKSTSSGCTYSTGAGNQATVGVTKFKLQDPADGIRAVFDGACTPITSLDVQAFTCGGPNDIYAITRGVAITVSVTDASDHTKQNAQALELSRYVLTKL